MKKLAFILLLIPLFASGVNHYVHPDSTTSTLTQVNALPLSPGDSVSFACGYEWNGQLLIQSGSAAGYVTYTSYGTGALPKISRYESLNTSGSWSDQGGNIWQYSGLTTEISNIVLNEVTAAHRDTAGATLTTQGHFYYDFDGDYVRMYSTSNPATFYSDLKGCLKDRNVYANGDSYFILENLDLSYSGFHSFWGTNASHAILRRLFVNWSGGSYYNGGPTREGNGISFWIGCSDVLVENCIILNSFDAGLTTQYVGGSATIQNVTFRDCYVVNAEYGIEFFNPDAGSTNSNINFTDNVLVNSGYGWGHNNRPDQNYGNGVMAGRTTADYSGVTVSGNIFYNSYRNHIYSDSDPYISSNNNVFLSNKISELQDVVYTEFYEHQQTGLDANSDSIYVVPIIIYNPNLSEGLVQFNGKKRKLASGTWVNNSYTIEPMGVVVFVEEQTIIEVPEPPKTISKSGNKTVVDGGRVITF